MGVERTKPTAFDREALPGYLRDAYDRHVAHIQEAVGYVKQEYPDISQEQLDEMRERHLAFQQASIMERAEENGLWR